MSSYSALHRVTGRHGWKAVPRHPAPVPDFGPLLGAQWVRDNAAPRAVTDPGGGITFTSRADLQTKIDANVAGSIFVKSAGGTLDWDAGVNAGAKRPKIYFLGTAGVDSAIIDGGARQIIGINSDNGQGIQVHGGLWQNFGNTVATVTEPLIIKAGGLLEDAEFKLNKYRGFELWGSNITCRYVYTHDNGFQGCSITREGTQDFATGLLVEHVRMANNNTDQNDPGLTAGTVKITRQAQGVVRYCWVHDNYGFGLWMDTPGTPAGTGENVQFLENVCENNLRAGIFLEGARQGCHAQRNYLKGNGTGTIAHPQTETNGWQITVSSADGSPGGLDIERNVIDCNVQGQAKHPWAIGLFNSSGHPDDCKAINVSRNQIWIRFTGSQGNQAVGGVDNQTPKTLWAETSNTFDENEYHVLDLTHSNWRWDSPPGDIGANQTWAQWQAFGSPPGFDTNGSRTVI